jgi:16S rRNA C1402 N4-methylase RsmH
MEFKVHDAEDENTLADTVDAALKQIDDKKYSQILTDHGVSPEHIQKYGFAFEGKKVLIG